MDDDISRLEELLAAEDSDEEAAVEQKDTTKPSQFLDEVVENEINILSHKKAKNKIKSSEKNESSNGVRTKDSAIHTGDTDSSDDEDKRNYHERRYNDYGSEIKKLIEVKDSQNVSFERSLVEKKSFSKTPLVHKEKIGQPRQPPKATTNGDVYSDPIFHLRMINPLISNQALSERMQGREAISMFKAKRHVAHGDLSKDWVIAGVIVRKSGSKESQKGSQFCIWTLSDLKDDLKTVSVFLFRNAYKDLWKTTEGTVVGVLNPNVLDKRDESKDEACLSVDNPDRVMIMGKSKDFGFCKSKKKNGENCTSFVNLYQCQYCVYHVKQEYQKCSKRADLQGSISNKGVHDLRNKVLGKDTYIYGGQSFSAIPAKKNKKMTHQDNNRLQSLSNYFKSQDQDQLMINKSPNVPSIKKKMASRIDVDRSQRLKDLERIKMLQGSLPDSPRSEIKSPPLSQSKLILSTSSNAFSPQPNSPKLGVGLKKEATIDLNLSFGLKRKESAKSNAINWIKQNGPLKKVNPNNIRGSTEGKKRLLDLSINPDDENNEPSEKKAKTEALSDNFKKMLQASSAHADLVVQHDNAEQDKYFNKLEMKEAMEEKMLNTFKVACKGVRCLKCSYTNFSASEKCKQEKHPLKVFDTFKRFFKCSNCNNRTVSLDIIPLHSCKNCQMNKWQRAPMMNERKCLTTADTLSIRGGEEKFIGSCVRTGANINLLVPDD